MNLIVDGLALIAVLALLLFFLLFLPVIFMSISITNRLRAIDFQSTCGYTPKGILDESIKQSRDERRFFNQGEWPDIKDPKLIRDSKKHYRLSKVMRWAAIIFGVSYVGVMGLNTLFHSYF